MATRGVREDAHRHPLGGQSSERVDILDQVLAAHDQLTGGRGLVWRVDATLNELPRRITRQQPRVRIERMPTAGVARDRMAQPRRELREELFARQPARREPLSLVEQAVDRPSHVSYSRKRTRNIPTCRGWSARAAAVMLHAG